MKKIFCTFLIIFYSFFCTFNTSFGYEISKVSKEKLEKTINYLNTDLDLRDYGFYKEKLEKIDKLLLENKSNYENWYVLYQIKKEIENILINNYIVVSTDNEDINSISDSKLELYDKYYSEIQNDYLEEKCLKYYDFIDEIAKKNDFPTSLIIATWRVENSCNLKNPDNGDGPFQILSQYYTPGEISLDEFAIQIQDFIDFSKYKWKSYEKNESAKYHFGKDVIDITYDDFSELDLRIHASLYNGLRSSKMYDATYINGNLTPDLTRKKDGILTIMVKTIDYEIKKNP